MTNSVTKIDFSKKLSKKFGFSVPFSKKIVDDLLIIFSEAIVTSDLNLTNFGSFKLLFKKERKGRNPKTKQEFIIAERKSISFKASEKLIKYINR
tara:strand:+ start:916 stop:1200 length:285 start_codon:yes stop_codon:yes gene_type:complete